MRRDRKLTALCVAGVAALALSACHAANNAANTTAETTTPPASDNMAAPAESGAAPATSTPPAGQ